MAMHSKAGNGPYHHGPYLGIMMVWTPDVRARHEVEANRAQASHRQQLKSDVMEGLGQGAVHPVCQLGGHGMDILEYGSQQNGPPSLPG